MLVQTSHTPRNLRLKFFSIYALSVALIVVIVLAVFRGEANANTGTEGAAPAITEESTWLNEAHVALQTKLQALSQAYLSNSSNVQAGQKPAPVQSAEIEMKKTLEELKATVASENNPKVQEEAQNLLAFFQNNFNQQSQLYTQLVTKTPLKQENTSAQANFELQQLRDQLNQKDKDIASLQASLRDRPVVNSQPASDDAKVWKDRASSLKATNEKLSRQINTITASYQVVVEDNRRLLSRLEASKKQ